jgi:ComEC/Rec2-related protein
MPRKLNKNIVVMMLLIVFILMKTMHELQNSRNILKENTKNFKIIVLYKRFVSADSCKFSYKNYVFFVRNCPLVEVGDILEVTSRGVDLNDKGEIGEIRLTSPSITINKGDAVSGKYSFLSFLGLFSTVLTQSQQKIAHALPPTNAELVNGMLFGNNYSPSAKLSELLKKSGLNYLMKISSLQIYLIMEVYAFFLAKALRKNLFVAIQIVILLLYLTILGPTVALYRVVSVLLLRSFAKNILKRQYHSSIFLIESALLVLSINPFIILNLDFQFTYLASFGILLASSLHFSQQREGLHKHSLINTANRHDDIKRLINQINKHFLSGFKMVLCLQVVMTPLILYYFGEANVISLVSGPAVMWFIPLLSLLAHILIILLWFFPLGAQIWSIGVFVLSSFLLTVIQIFSVLSEKWIKIHFSMNKIEVIAIYMFYLLIYMFLRRNQAKTLLHSR